MFLLQKEIFYELPPPSSAAVFIEEITPKATLWKIKHMQFEFWSDSSWLLLDVKNKCAIMAINVLDGLVWMPREGIYTW